MCIVSPSNAQQADTLRASPGGAQPPDTVQSQTPYGAAPSESPADTGQSRPSVGTAQPELPFVQGGIYDKPFITRLGGRTSIGGYGDFQFRTERENGVTEEVTFRLPRFNLFTYSVVSDRVRLSSEIEFEHGGEEIKIEYGIIDFEIREELNLRAGIILSPLGKFNLAHDSPQNELTDRPLVVTEIIPSTLSEPGMGFWGAFYPSPNARITYELYAVNGFNEGIINGAATRIREGRGDLEEDNNNVPALVGRIALSPLRGMELAGSFHMGQYNVSTEEGVQVADREYLKIFGVDWEYRRGPFSFLGEYAHAGIGIPSSLTGFLAGSQQGLYAQAGWRFLDGLTAALPHSSLSGVVRMDAVDFDTAIKGDALQRVTFGLNFRPAPDTVFKLDYQINGTFDGVNNKTPGRAFLFSMATYF
jgi:hypothetical protein